MDEIHSIRKSKPQTAEHIRRRVEGWHSSLARSVAQQCLECGENFVRKSAAQRYCTKSCFQKAYDRRRASQESERYSFRKIPDHAYARLIKLQGNACAICGATFGDSRGARLCVDHVHGTCFIRGLLCRACNLAIGALSDNPRRLRAAADYLERSPLLELTPRDLGQLMLCLDLSEEG